MPPRAAWVVGVGALAVILSGMAVAGFLSDTGTEEMTHARAARDQGETASPGRALFQTKGCSGCHALAGVSDGRVGPDLTDLPRVAGRRKPGYSAEDYVRESILDPQALIVAGFGSIAMPKLPVTEEEAEALASFLLAR